MRLLIVSGGEDEMENNDSRMRKVIAFRVTGGRFQEGRRPMVSWRRIFGAWKLEEVKVSWKPSQRRGNEKVELRLTDKVGHVWGIHGV